MNAKLLKDKIKESGLKITFVAESCGLTYQGFANKINGIRDFKLVEADKLKQILNISDDDFKAIFFDNDVDNTTTCNTE